MPMAHWQGTNPHRQVRDRGRFGTDQIGWSKAPRGQAQLIRPGEKTTCSIKYCR